MLTVLTVALLASCNNTKHLGRGQLLYKGAGVSIKSDTNLPNKKTIKHELEDALYPEPNNEFLGIFPLRLWVYNQVGEVDNNKGLKHWLKYEFGEEPVLMNDIDPQAVERLLKNRLINNGYFRPSVDYTIKTHKKQSRITYTATLDRPYRINSLHYPDSGAILQHEIQKLRENTLLDSASIYNLETLKKERQRIDKALLEKGFYYFAPDYLIFKVDSSAMNNTVDLFLKIKKKTPREARSKYKIKRVLLYPNFSLEDTLSTSCVDTLSINGIEYITRKNSFIPETVVRQVSLRPGEMYNRLEHEETLGRLMGMGIFKFVNIRFRKAGFEADTGLLNAHVYLTPQTRQSFRAELKGSAKSNNFAGPGMELNYTHRNLFKGAEKLSLNLHGSWETQISSGEDLSQWEYGIDARLDYPRLESPFGIKLRRSRFVPKTNIGLGFEAENRIKYFSTYSFFASFGYSWKENRANKHQLDLVSVDYFNVGRKTDAFNNILRDNPFLQNTFSNQFLIGPDYTFTYNEGSVSTKKTSIYFQGRSDFSGLILEQMLKGVNAIDNAVPTNELFDISYAQYARFDGDFRFYHRLDRKSRMAYRFFAGSGFPIGNSKSLPYIKQYYAGGTNDIRAFRARTLGPGGYIQPDSLQNNLFIDQTGDIKLEANAEYRFKILNILEGAVFVDAGNIWLKNKDDERPQGQFKVGNFHRQIAVGTGLGLRLDISFLVLRTDLAFPLRNPSLPRGDRWVHDEIFGYKGWAGDNLVLNIAIGYPF